MLLGFVQDQIASDRHWHCIAGEQEIAVMSFLFLDFNIGQLEFGPVILARNGRISGFEDG